MRTIDGDDDSYDEINKKYRKIWRNADGQIHRDGDLPAIILNDGHIWYYKDGKPHRNSGLPAVIWSNGCSAYYVYGRFITQFDKYS